MRDIPGILRATAGIHPHLNADARKLLTQAAAEIEHMRAALGAIERVGWREGTKFQEWLLECRGIARDALVSPHGT